jgi:signal transduction histidine kinase
MQSGRPVRDVRHAIETADGKKVLLSINSAPLFDESGRIDGVVSTVENMTDRASLNEFHSNVNDLLEVLAEPVVVTDLQGRVELANRKALVKLNCSLEAIKSESIQNCLQAQIGGKLKQKLAEVIQSGRPARIQKTESTQPIGIYPLFDPFEKISKIALINIELGETSGV